MTTSKNATPLRFNGSVWCNLDIALRNLDQVFGQVVQPIGLTVIEWYILRALYEHDGQHASELARAVGRAATSFTPNLDKLQNKGLVERRADPADRRAVRIYLTDEARKCKKAVMDSVKELDDRVGQVLGGADFEVFNSVLATLQNLSLD